MADVISSIRNSAHYNVPGWEVVRLVDYFEREEIETMEAFMMVKGWKDWCEGSVPLDGWQCAGVTKYSFRFLFKDQQDALLFKLKFGI